MAEALPITDRLTLPADEIAFSFARSSGPGGQNVNKVSTKAVLRWSPLTSAALSETQRSRLLERLGSRLTKGGELVLSSDEHRERSRNVAACRARLKTLVAAAIRPSKRRLATRPSRGANERRLAEKRRKSQRKRQRRRPMDET